MNVAGLVMEMGLQKIADLDMERHTEAEAEEFLEKGIVAVVGGRYAVVLADVERIEVEIDEAGFLMNVAYSVEGDRLCIKI